MEDFIKFKDLTSWLKRRSSEFDIEDVAPVGWTLLGLINDLDKAPLMRYPMTTTPRHPPIEVESLSKEGCRFCELLQGMKELHRDCNISRKLSGKAPVRNKFGAALVDRTFRGRTIYASDGRYRFRLNYCPECGRSLKKGKQ